MKTFRILLISILSLVLLQTVTAAVTAPAQESVPTLEKSRRSDNLVKVVLQNGAYMPVVDLPVIEIVSTKPGSHLLETVIKNGRYMIEFDLPEVEITATHIGAKRIRAYVHNGETIAILDLPMVEIKSVFPYNRLISASGNITAALPVVNLPEINITPSVAGNYLLSANFQNGILVPYIDLPVIEIKPEYTWKLAAGENEFVIENSDLEWIYISLQNCGITSGNKIVCEVTSKTNYGASVLPGAAQLNN